MKIFICICFILFFTLIFAQTRDEKEFMGDQVEVMCVRPDIEESVSFEATIPQGWKRNPYFGTVVYQPQNADDYYEPPNIEFQVLCEGECKAEIILENIENYINRLKEGWKTLSTGDAELDKLGAIVDVITEEKSDSQWLLEVKLTYPEGVSSDDIVRYGRLVAWVRSIPVDIDTGLIKTGGIGDAEAPYCNIIVFYCDSGVALPVNDGQAAACVVAHQGERFVDDHVLTICAAIYEYSVAVHRINIIDGCLPR